MLQYVNERHTGYSFETPPGKDKYWLFERCTCVPRGKLLPCYSHFYCNHEGFPNTFDDSFTKSARNVSFGLLVLGSHRVELGSYKERNMYLMWKLCNSVDSMLRQSEVVVLFVFLRSPSVSLRHGSFYHTMQLRVTVHLVWLMWLICDVTVTAVYLIWRWWVEDTVQRHLPLP